VFLEVILKLWCMFHEQTFSLPHEHVCTVFDLSSAGVSDFLTKKQLYYSFIISKILGYIFNIFIWQSLEIQWKKSLSHKMFYVYIGYGQLKKIDSFSFFLSIAVLLVFLYLIDSVMTVCYFYVLDPRHTHLNCYWYKYSITNLQWCKE
jgi:hypothetical protein